MTRDTSRTERSLKSEAGQSAPYPVFESEDWTKFRNLETLGQKAGVAQDNLPKLVLKELVDNALDTGSVCTVGLLPNGGAFIEDEGTGIPGGAEGIGRLFSINRPLLTTKSIRLPSRGALGNGLRVVAGAVLATAGRMVVSTRGSRYKLRFHDDGTTTTQQTGAYAKQGTRIELWLGKEPWRDGFCDDDLQWARRAIALAGHGKPYAGLSSPYWYTSDAFYALLDAAGDLAVQDLAAQLDGCSIGERSRWHGRACSSLTRKEADDLLNVFRAFTKEVEPTALGHVGKAMPGGYAKAAFVRELAPVRGSLEARIPYVLEVWARPDYRDSLELSINRTPVTADVKVQRDKAELCVFGCGLAHGFAVGRAPIAVKVNVTTPYMPITSDGKAPDMRGLLDELRETIEKAARAAKRIYSTGERGDSAKARILANLDEAIKKASGDGQFSYSLRQLFYGVHPMVTLDEKELLYKNFSTVIGDYEADHGPLAGLYRDPRGVLYHPHTHEEIQLGTKQIDGYERPAWIFNKALYIEKEGIISILCQDRWPERNDCALLSSKGFASRAARDLLDQLGETDEELLFFCAHDADAAGTMIYQSLQEATAARPARKVKIIDLGLQPWEGIAMGLPVEPMKYKRVQPVADYVLERDDGEEWEEWLQHHRIELNAMTTPQLFEWLDRKMAEHGQGRLVPPAEVLTEHLNERARARIEASVKEAILEENDYMARVESEYRRELPALQAKAASLPALVRDTLEEPETAAQSWFDVVDAEDER